MNLVQPIGNSSVQHSSPDPMPLEEQAKELCHMLRVSLRKFHEIMGIHEEEMEEANQRSVKENADSYRGWISYATLIARVATPLIGLGGTLGVNATHFSNNTKKALGDAFKAAPQMVGAGCDTLEHYKTASRIEIQSVSDRSKRQVEKSSHDLQTIASQLHEMLEAIRQINNDMAQTMRAVKQG